MNKIRGFACVGVCLLAFALKGQNQAPTANSPRAAAAASASDLNALRQRIAQQEEQIQKLQQAVNEQRSLLDAAVQNISNAARAPEPANGNGAPLVSASSSSDGAPLAYVNASGGGKSWSNAHIAGQNLQASVKQSPLSIPIGTSTFTPLGFVDFTWYGRSSNVGSGIGTNFGGVPYNTAPGGHLSENNFTAQNSRIGFRVDSKVLGAKVLGYFEADFLGNQPANIFVTSNADTFRMRNVFADIQWHKWEFLGGQDWSMFTPNRKGLSPIPADVFFTQNMDTNYQAGLPWSRQGQFRTVYHATKDLALGLSIENPQQYIGGSGGLAATAVTLPASLAGIVGPQFNNAVNPIGSGSTANGGGNFTTPNLHPDFIVKGAYDAHVGDKDKIFHMEAGALIRSFKDSIPTGTPTRFTSHSATGVTGTVNVNLEVVKNVKLIANTFFGQGGGRYLLGTAPDVIIRANGDVSPVHAYSTVDGVEFNISKNALISAYYGGAYIGRQVALDNPATNGSRPFIGYGFRGSANADNKSLQEATIGLTQTLWKSPSYGALSLINQYSWLTRDPWAVAIGAPKATHTNLYYIDLRYTIP